MGKLAASLWKKAYAQMKLKKEASHQQKLDEEVSIQRYKGTLVFDFYI